jgi:23S rRNA (cytidine1920-2'-O)/16S rRNA (cytidine1409-2'-O)-methyltransferase
MFDQKLVNSRSQAENFIKLGLVTLNGKVCTTASTIVDDRDDIKLTTKDTYVSRAGLKLASVVQKLGVDFAGKSVLDIGSSTGGFTDYALQHGASKVLAVDVGTNQLHPKLHGDPRIELHEQTDIRNFITTDLIDIILIDVSFISMRDIWEAVLRHSSPKTQIIAMVKPQFEAGREQINKGVIKNDHMRRDILKSFELWVRQTATIITKSDSEVAGTKGNLERFYLIKKL